MDFEENSSDIELTLDIVNAADDTENMELGHITTECVTLDKIGLMKKCNRMVDLDSELNSTNSLDNDLSHTAHLIEETFESDDFDKADEFDSQFPTDKSFRTNSKSICIDKSKDVADVSNSNKCKEHVEKLLLSTVLTATCSIQNKLPNTNDTNSAEMNGDQSLSKKYTNGTPAPDKSATEKLVLQNDSSCDIPNGIVHFNCNNNSTDDANAELISDDNRKNVVSEEKTVKNCVQNEVVKISSTVVNLKVAEKKSITPLLNGIVDTLEELPEKGKAPSLPKTSLKEKINLSTVPEDEIISDIIIEQEICDNGVDSQKTNNHVEVFNGIPVPESSKLENTSRTDNQKRKLCLESNLKHDIDLITGVPNHTVEKCAKLDDDDIHNKLNNVIDSTSIQEKEEHHSSIEKKRRISVNTARKKTGSSSSKVMKGIDQILRSELLKKQEENSLISMLNGDIPQDAKKYKECAENSSNDSSKCQSENVANCDRNYKIRLKTETLSEDNLKCIFKTMRKRLTRRQLEEIILQKCCEVISESSEIGELKKQVVELQQAEIFRKQTVNSLEKQLHQLRGVCSVFMEKVKTLKLENRISTPAVITRSVGLQVAFDSNPYVRSESSSSTAQYFEDEQSRNKSTSSIRSNKGTRDLIGNSLSSKMYPTPSSSPALDATSVDSRASPSSSGGESSGKSSLQSDSINNETSIPGRTSPVYLKKSNNNIPTPVAADAETAIIDLTDKDDKNDSTSVENTVNDISPHPVSQVTPSNQNANGSRPNFQTSRPRNHVVNSNPSRHPAPLPPTPVYSKLQNGKRPPPIPELKLYKTEHGISLSWNMVLTKEHAEIAKYEINAYQETQVVSSADLWKSVGAVEALPLPMACTLTQFVSGFTYHFSVRAMDVYQRLGPFSLAKSIAL